MSQSHRQIQSLVREDGVLEIRLREVTVAEPGPDDVVVRVEAAPINPSDLGLLFGSADMSNRALLR
jgi:NADPH2:quinone reductase